MRSDGFSFRNHQSMISFISVNKAFNRLIISVKSLIFIYPNQNLYLCLYYASYYSQIAYVSLRYLFVGTYVYHDVILKS